MYEIPGQKQSLRARRAERRAREEQRRRFEAARQAMAASQSGRPGPAGAVPGPGFTTRTGLAGANTPASPDATPAAPSAVARTAGPLRWFVALLVSTGAAAAVVTAGVPALGHGWQLVPLAGSLTVGAASTFLLSVWSGLVSARARTISIAAACLLIVGFAVGAQTTIVLDGRPILSSSEEARAIRDFEALEADLRTLAVLDDLIRLGQTDARARFDEYEPAISNAGAISRRWAGREITSFTDPALAEVAAHLKTAGEYGRLALEAKLENLRQVDALREEQILSYRQTLLQETFAALPLLRDFAAAYSITFIDDDGGPVE